MIEIREARPEEYEAAGAATAAAWEPWPDESFSRFATYIRDVAARAKISRVFVAVEDGNVLGSVSLEMDLRMPELGREWPPLPPEEAHVRTLGVAPSAKRRGAGRRLMEHCVQYARDHGKSVITLHTGEQNIAAQHLYESMGFKRMADLTAPNGHPIRSYRYEISKPLAT